MALSESLLLLSLALVVAVMLMPIAPLLKLPFSVLLVLCGAIAGLVIEWSGWDIGLRWYHFRDLVFNLFLPVLVFESALHIKQMAFRRVFVATLLLALPLMILASLATAVLLYWGVGHPSGFPWIAALLCGVMLSATDPVAVVDLLKKLGVSDEITMLLDGESLLNDAVAIVLFTTFLALALQQGAAPVAIDWWSIAGAFVSVLSGGIAMGVVAAWLLMQAQRLIAAEIVFSVVSVVAVFGVYLLAEHYLHWSGVPAVLIVGLALAPRVSPLIKNVWAHHAFIANALVFILMGLTVQWMMFTERYLAIGIGIAAVLVVRAALIYSSWPLLSRLPGVPRLSFGQQRVLVWGGLRGVIAAALALSLPLELDYWFTIQSVVYGVVLFTLLVQAPTMGYSVKKGQL